MQGEVNDPVQGSYRTAVTDRYALPLTHRARGEVNGVGWVVLQSLLFLLDLGVISGRYVV